MSRVLAILLLAISFFDTTPLLAQRAPAWRPGEVLVYLAKDASIQAVHDHLTRTLPNGTSVAKEVQLGDGSRYHRIVFQGGGLADAELLERAAQVPGVERSSLNYLVEHLLAPNDPQYAAQWHMQSINVEPVWNVTTGGAMANGMRIAVGINDTEVQANHPDLAGNMLIGQPGAGDSHGTEVAGVVGAVGNNSLGVTGVNWDVDLVSFANTNDLSDAFLQFQLCLNQRTAFNNSGGTNGAMIVAITVSWGAPGVNCGFGDPLFDDLGAQGVLVITAGPNSPTDIDVVDDYPSTCPNANNIVVTSLGPLGQIPFAVGNNTVHLLAPGVGIVTTEIGGGFATVDGNSFAIPHVAGAVALLYSNDCPQFAAAALIDPQGTAIAVKDAILNSVTPVAGASALTITGGKLNVSAAFNLLNAGCTSFCEQVDVSITGPLVPNMTVFVVNADGQTVAQQQASNFSTCLPAGCYFVALLDQDGLPTDGTVTVTDANGDTLVSSATTNGSLSFSSGAVVFGCTNPNSANFNPAADCDDGSCCAALATISLSDSGADGWEGATYTLANSLGTFSLSGTLASGASSDTTLCLPDGCYTMTVTAGTDSAEVAWSITGVGINPVSDGAGTTTSLSAGNVVFGCTDPNGCNYDPQANCSAGCVTGSLISVVVFGNDFPEEMGWTLFEPDGDVLLSGGADVQLTTCAAPGCDYVMEMTDSFGDGWNGGGYIIFTDNGNIDGSLFFGALGADTIAINAISGCTDTLANNFNTLAVCEDGSCCYGPGEIPLSITVDAFSLPVTWALEGSTGDTLASGGNVFDMKACAVPGCDQLITMTAPNASGWQGGAYTITSADGSWTTTGTLEIGTAGSDPIAVGNTFGCIDPLANNFDPAATCDNGTCCYGAELPVIIFSQPPGPDSTWVLLNAADSLLYTSNGAFQQQTCVEPACQLTLIIEDPAGDGSPSFVDLNAVDFSSAANAFADEGDSTATTFAFGLVQGCTDTLANNYDPSASCENGTCCYGTTSLVIFSAPSLVIGWQVVDTAGTVVAQATSAPTQNACVEPSCALTVTVTDSVPDGFEESLFVFDEATGVQNTFTPADGGTLTEPIILGGTSGCTDTAAVNYDPNALCDDGSCCFGTLATLFLQADDFFSEGVADVTITQGSTTVFSGLLPIVFDDNIGVSYGQFGFCAANGCLSISVGEFDVPLFFQSFLSLDNDPNNPIEFITLQGLQTSIGAPAGTEVCDGIDNDCDGVVDEGLAVLWYPDLDNDGFGDDNAAVTSCASIPGLITTGGDCDDGNAGINPAASDPCAAPDGIDNNCDGSIDEVLLWYADTDGDGFGNDATVQSSCTPIPGMINTGGDCNDADVNLTTVGAACDDGDPATVNDIVQPNCTCMGFVPGNCPPGETEDCNGNCAPSEWVGDGTCDDGSFDWEGNFIFFNCAQFANDGGDCAAPCTTEVCDGIDNDCDGAVDEGVIVIYYADADGDGFGLDGSGVPGGCQQPPGTALVAGDCNDTDADINPGVPDLCGDGLDNNCNGIVDDPTIWYQDADADGSGNAAVTLTACAQPIGFVASSDDCDDTDPNEYPLAGPGLGCSDCSVADRQWIADNYLQIWNLVGIAMAQCSSATPAGLWACLSGQLQFFLPIAPACQQCVVERAYCSFNACAAPCVPWLLGSNQVLGGTEACNQCAQASGCNTSFAACVGLVDLDGDGYPSTMDCNDTSAIMYPDASELCDGIDNNCNGQIDEGVIPTWYADLDGDSFGDNATTITQCSAPPGYVAIGNDCNDTNNAINPGAQETCNGFDDDCSGIVDDALLYADLDGDGYGNASAPVDCSISGAVLNSDDCDDNNAGIHPGAPDPCAGSDGMDNDCDGSIDEDGLQLWHLDADGDGFGLEAVTMIACSQPPGFSPVAGDCNDSEALAYTSAPELCDAIDNDCDGEVDEGFNWYTDADGDGVGTFAFPIFSCTPIPGRVNIGGDCNDNDPGVQLLVYFGIPLEQGATAQYVITNGGVTYTGTIMEAPLSPGIGLVNLCLANGCVQLTITTSGVPPGTLAFFGEALNTGSSVTFVPEDGLATTLGGEPSAELCDGIDNDCDGTVDEACAIHVHARVFLDGAFNTTTGRMNDPLRALGLVPTTQPYATPPFNHAGSETVAPAVLASADPDNAIVDWVLLELRDAATPTTVLHRRAALVQRDGDVVDTDGSSPVSFTASSGPYHVAIRHRNHFGVMTAAPLPLSATPTVIDLTTASTATFGTEARKGLPAGTMLLWGCNARPDALMRYTGVNNDRDPMLIAVGGSVPTAVLPNVYRSEDVNLDGTVKYTNVNNDRDPLLINVNWGFGTTSVTRQRFEQLP